MATRFKNQETIAFGSPMVVRAVGFVVISMIGWVGYTSYDNNILIKLLVHDNAAIKEATGKLIADTAKKTELVALEVRIRDTEKAIEELKSYHDKAGGPNDPWYIKFEDMKKELSQMNESLSRIRNKIELEK